MEPLGEKAVIIRDIPGPAYMLAEWLEEQLSVEACASYDTVGVYFDREVESLDSLLEKYQPDQALARPTKSHLIPVCYALGEDLAATAASLRLSEQDIIALHSGREYSCYAVGFCPGFGYLGYLPEQLQGIPRRSSPRARVPAGSVAITGDQTAVYPLQTPGGWALIGRTPLTLVDVKERYFPIAAGDTVCFIAIDPDEFRRLQGERL